MRPKLVKATKHEQRDATVLGGLRLRYVDVRANAEEGPPVVLLHGLASRIEEYEQLVDLLHPRRRVIVLDLPGNGYSDKPDRAYTLELLEDSVLGLLDELSIQSADLAGGSLGGNLVLRLAHRAPQRFRRLAPWAPAGAWERMRRWELVSAITYPFRESLFWPSIWIQSRFWYRKDWPGREEALQQGFAHYREVYGPGFLRMYFEIGREQVKTSLFPIAAGIAHPTLLLVGGEDRALGMREGVERLATLLPRAKLVVFEGARHSLANEQPERLAGEVDAFLVDPKII